MCFPAAEAHAAQGSKGFAFRDDSLLTVVVTRAYLNYRYLPSNKPKHKKTKNKEKPPKCQQYEIRSKIIFSFLCMHAHLVLSNQPLFFPQHFLDSWNPFSTDFIFLCVARLYPLFYFHCFVKQRHMCEPLHLGVTYSISSALILAKPV